MPKTTTIQPLVWKKHGQAGQQAFHLAAALSLGMALCATGWAEPGSDLTISKDGGNINVNLNTASSSDVSIRRSDDIMVIKVPKSYQGGVNIDPALKKNSVVHEEETPSGKAITIQSQQIYLHTWDGEPGGGQSASTPKGEKAEPKAATDSHHPDGNTKENATKTEPKGGFLYLSPVTGLDKEDQTTPAASSNRQRHNPGVPNKAPKGEQPISPLDLTRILEQGSLLSEPTAPAPRARHTGTSGAVNSGAATSNTKTQQTKNDKNEGSGKHNKPEALAKTKVQEQNKTNTTQEPPLNADPELEPLEADSKQQAAAIQASINGLLRIFFSLVVVLGMIAGFVKVLLPRLLERYPDFFERLRERKQWSDPMPNPLTNSRKKELSTPKAQRQPKAEPAPSSIQALAKSVAQQFGTSAPEPSKKSYLERLKLAGEYFQVLQTTMLGKGKELHLVELKGKQFLVATTPYTVTLLKELSDETSASGSAPTLEPSFPPPETRQITQRQSTSPARPSTRPVQPPMATTPHHEAPAQSQTIAYLSDETPIRRVTATKPYATSPGLNPQARRKSAVPQFPAPPEDVYQSYLPRPHTTPTPQMPGAPQPNASTGREHGTTQQPLQPAYIDAEEVVVLEDYDDFYGR